MDRWTRIQAHSYTERVIYCVVPPELEEELYEKLLEYYKDNPNVKVIIDRRKGPDRRNRKGAGDDGAREQRTIRDRRRRLTPSAQTSLRSWRSVLPRSWREYSSRSWRIQYQSRPLG